MGLQRCGHDLAIDPQKEGDIWKYLENFFSCHKGRELHWDLMSGDQRCY